jgi:glycosyltransferase involved in cell wall biosynthesis
MRLLIISHTPHYGPPDSPAGLGSTLREIDQIASLFQTVCHLAPLHPGSPPMDCSPYKAGNVAFRPVPPAGGETLSDKARIVQRLPGYAGAIADEVRKADAVHVRCPANISLCALSVLRSISWKGPTWIKYAGNWGGYPGEPLSYRLQRAWLGGSWRDAVVTVNGTWQGQPRHVVSLENPCLTEDEIRAARSASEGKQLATPIRLLFVGRVDADKGVPQFLRMLSDLAHRGLDVMGELVGSGPLLNNFQTEASRLGIRERIEFRGWLPRTALDESYKNAHFIVLPSRAEGWPKVLSEAMAHGAVPITSAVGSIPQYLSRFGVGKCLEPADWQGFARAVAGYASNPERWKAESARASEAAGKFTYSTYCDKLRGLLLPSAACYAAASSDIADLSRP